MRTCHFIRTFHFIGADGMALDAHVDECVQCMFAAAAGAKLCPTGSALRVAAERADAAGRTGGVVAPRPWSIQRVESLHNDHEIDYQILDAEGNVVADVDEARNVRSTRHAREDAEAIVHMANTYDDLLAAREAALPQLEDALDGGGWRHGPASTHEIATVKFLRAAIAKAKP